MHVQPEMTYKSVILTEECCLLTAVARMLQSSLQELASGMFGIRFDCRDSLR